MAGHGEVRQGMLVQKPNGAERKAMTVLRDWCPLRRQQPKEIALLESPGTVKRKCVEAARSVVRPAKAARSVRSQSPE